MVSSDYNPELVANILDVKRPPRLNGEPPRLEFLVESFHGEAILVQEFPQTEQGLEDYRGACRKFRYYRSEIRVQVDGPVDLPWGSYEARGSIEKVE